MYLLYGRYTRQDEDKIQPALLYAPCQKIADGGSSYNMHKGYVRSSQTYGGKRAHRRRLPPIAQDSPLLPPVGVWAAQFKAALPNIKQTQFENGIYFNMIDVEKFVYKFTFPAPGKTCGFVHDDVIKKLGEDKAIKYRTAIYLVVGMSVGACVPVLLSAIGANKEGKQTAFSYLDAYRIFL